MRRLSWIPMNALQSAQYQVIRRVWLPLLVLSMMGLETVRVRSAHSPNDTGKGSRKTILAAHEDAILYRSGTTYVMQSPERCQANPVLAAAMPWELAIGYCSVFHDPVTGLYQAWYQAYAGSRAEHPTRRVVLCYATSRDGLHWEKPKLRLFDFNENPETNIVLVGNGGRSVNYGASVLVDPRDADPQRRYKLAYWDFVELEGIQKPGLCVAFSPDGIHWKKHPQGPLLQGAYGDPTQPPLAGKHLNEPAIRPAISDVMDLMWDPPHQRFVIYSKTWIDAPDGRRFWKRAVVRTTSTDFIHWTPPEMVLSPADHDHGQLHGASVFFHQGLYLALVQRLDFGGFDRGGTGNMPAELAWSQDGRHWQRPFEDRMFLGVSGKGDRFDAGCLWTSATPVHLEGETRLYYGAYPAWDADLSVSPTGIGMARVPRDRFIGIAPVDVQGQVTFRPIHLDGHRAITLNADATHGALRLEILSAGGYGVEGYTRADAMVLKGDHLAHSAAWKYHTLEDLRPGAYQLRVHLRHAQLYALSLQQ